MLTRQVYVLKVWQDSRGEIHATLKDGLSNKTRDFSDLEGVLEYLKAQFKPGNLEPAQPKSLKEQKR